MNFVCLVFELGDKTLTLSPMENLMVKCNLISRCVTEALRYVTFIHDLSRLLARSITACYVLLRSVAF